MKRNKRRRAKTRRSQKVERTPKRTYKDELFRMIFGREDARSARWRLDLYNALSGKHHTNPADLKITTLENAIYIEMKNDVSFLVDSQMERPSLISLLRGCFVRTFYIVQKNSLERIYCMRDGFGTKTMANCFPVSYMYRHRRM